MNKKILALLLSAALLTAFTGCANENEDEQPEDAVTTVGDTDAAGDTAPETIPVAAPESAPGADAGVSVDEMTLEELMNVTLTGSGQEFGGFFATHPVTAEDVGFFLGAEEFTEPFEEALGYAPMVGSIAFQMILFRLPEGADAEAFAAAVKDSADARKWVCVEAESVQSAIRGRTVLFIMADTSTTDAVIGAFHQAAPEA